MAISDHTAHARRSVFTKPKSKSTASVDRPLYPLSAAQETRQTYVSKLAGTSLAVTTIQGLLEYSEAFARQQAQGKQPTLVPWPLTTAQISGLNAAIHFLRHYVDTLTPEPGG